MFCPICKKPVEESPRKPATFPFCSERCKLIDLGRWLDGKYTLPVDGASSADDVPPGSSTSPEKS